MQIRKYKNKMWVKCYVIWTNDNTVQLSTIF